MKTIALTYFLEIVAPSVVKLVNKVIKFKLSKISFA